MLKQLILALYMGFLLGLSTNKFKRKSAELIKTYLDEYKQLKEYMNDQISFARNHGYVETILGKDT